MTTPSRDRAPRVQAGATNLSSPHPANRRTFIKTAAAATAAGLIVPRGVHAQGENADTLNVGLIGCGGRGTGAAANALNGDANCVITAVGDLFADRLQQSVKILGREERFQVIPEHQFVGFDAYKQVVDSGVDVVILATPPHFRPAQLEYAVANGKHCFVEKPVAVDAPGVRSVLDTCRVAGEKGLSIVSGLCWRYDFGIRETIRQVLEEQAIGEITSIESEYLASQLWHRGDKPEWSRMEYQCRNWLYHTWLSGDHNNEQHVHSLDKVMWLMGDEPPVAAVGMGGRSQRVEPQFGDIYDHFSVTYEFANGVRAFCRCRQQNGCATNVDELVIGTNGHAKIIGHQINPHGGKRWKYDGDKPNMYDQEHRELFASIRNGEPINNGKYMAQSTMLAIMGRMTAYTGKRLTWDQCLASEQHLGPAEYLLSDNVPASVPAVPGVTEFV